MEKNLPLGIAQQYDTTTDTTVLTWCYRETADIQYFEIQYWDDDLRKWMPFDGRNGIVKKR